MPSIVALTLASIREKPFSSPDWLFEVKWDGVRGIAYVANGKVLARSRADEKLRLEYPEVGDLANQLDAEEAIVDGEIVALDEAGRSVFQKLQNRSGVRNPSHRFAGKDSRPLTTRSICCTAMATTCEKRRWRSEGTASRRYFGPAAHSLFRT